MHRNYYYGPDKSLIIIMFQFKGDFNENMNKPYAPNTVTNEVHSALYFKFIALFYLLLSDQPSGVIGKLALA